jgi:hypothetical protein
MNALSSEAIETTNILFSHNDFYEEGSSPWFSWTFLMAYSKTIRKALALKHLLVLDHSG